MTQQSIGRIALFTDFGEAGPYLGQMEAVLCAAGVACPVIRLMSDAPRCNPHAAAYLLAAVSRYMPASTLFLGVVDPGVGSARRPLLLRCGSHLFVGPDNGLFSQVIKGGGEVVAEVIDWRPQQLSSSFHGRDLFAPVAADCVLENKLERRVIPTESLVGSNWPQNLAEIIYIDHYGNCVTGISADFLSDTAIVSFGGGSIRFAETFSSVSAGDPFWYRNSMGLVEIAVNQGRADVALRLAIGSKVASNCPAA